MLSIYTRAQAALATRNRDDKGAVAVEYALIIGVIAVALIGALVAFGPALGDFVNGFSFTNVGTPAG